MLVRKFVMSHFKLDIGLVTPFPWASLISIGLRLPCTASAAPRQCDRRSVDTGRTAPSCVECHVTGRSVWEWPASVTNPTAVYVPIPYHPSKRIQTFLLFNNEIEGFLFHTLNIARKNENISKDNYVNQWNLITFLFNSKTFSMI